MGLKNLYDAKPVAIWVLGKPAEAELKRPFKAGGGLFGGESKFVCKSFKTRTMCVYDLIFL